MKTLSTNELNEKMEYMNIYKSQMCEHFFNRVKKFNNEKLFESI